MKLRYALRIKSAELWLKLGQTGPALMELQQLPAAAQNHPWASQVLRSAFRAARGMGSGESPNQAAA